MTYEEVIKLSEFALANYDIISTSIMPYIIRYENYSSEYYDKYPFYNEINKIQKGKKIKNGEAIISLLNKAEKEFNEAITEINNVYADAKRKKLSLDEVIKISSRMSVYAKKKNQEYLEARNKFRHDEMPNIRYGFNNDNKIIYCEKKIGKDAEQEFYIYQGEDILIYRFNKDNKGFLGIEAHTKKEDKYLLSLYMLANNHKMNRRVEYDYDGDLLVRSNIEHLEVTTYKPQHLSYFYNEKVLYKIIDENNNAIYIKTTISSLGELLDRIRDDYNSKLIGAFENIIHKNINTLGFYYESDSLAYARPFILYLTNEDIERFEPKYLKLKEFLESPSEWKNEILIERDDDISMTVDFMLAEIEDNRQKVIQMINAIAKNFRVYINNNHGENNLKILVSDIDDGDNTYY